MSSDASPASESKRSDLATSFAEFDRRARAGETLSVVFFGGSLTWGANASEPNLTSYRGLMGEYLRDKYPKSSFKIYDAAIGGTGSRLGIFRLQRDVLSRKPDLVFLDFSVNDDVDSDEPDRLNSYESLLRLMIGQGIAVFQTILGFRQHFSAPPTDDPPPRAKQHLQLSKAYQTGAGNVYPYIRAKVQNREVDLAEVYPFGNDGAHPDDSGYRMFFEVVRDAFEQAIRDNKTCVVPAKPVFADTYMKRSRIKLTDLPSPAGWRREKTYRIAMWFDGLPSRWMDDVMACTAVEKVSPFRVEFTGTLLAIFGDGDENALAFRAIVDAKPLLTDEKSDVWTMSTKGGTITQGRLFRWKELTAELSPGKHVLEIHPVPDPNNREGQLRIESVCVAG